MRFFNTVFLFFVFFCVFLSQTVEEPVICYFGQSIVLSALGDDRNLFLQTVDRDIFDPEFAVSG